MREEKDNERIKMTFPTLEEVKNNKVIKTGCQQVVTVTFQVKAEGAEIVLHYWVASKLIRIK